MYTLHIYNIVDIKIYEDTIYFIFKIEIIIFSKSKGYFLNKRFLFFDVTKKLFVISVLTAYI